MKVYLLVTIDTECDKGKAWLTQKPLSFESVVKGVPELYSPLFDKNEIKPTYLLSPEIIKDDASVEALKQAHCELGTHMHGEYIGPDENYDADRTNQIQAVWPKDIEYQKLKNLTDLFADKFGYQPKSFRAGRFGIGDHSLKILEELGYTVDSSVSPFKTHHYKDHQGKKNNFWGAPVQPYYPDYIKHHKSGGCKVLQVPVSIVAENYINAPRFVQRAMGADPGLAQKIYRRIYGASSKSIWLRPVRSDAKQMKRTSEIIIEKYKNSGKPIILTMMFHSNEIIPNASPYVSNVEEQEKFINDLDEYFKLMKKEYDYESIGLSEVKEVY